MAHLPHVALIILFQEMPHQENISKRKRSESDTIDDKEKENESADESGNDEDSPKGNVSYINII